MNKSRATIGAISTAAALTIGVLSAPSLAAADMFLKISDIEGESQDSKHKDEIDVLSWSWGFSQSDNGGRKSGVCVQDLSFVKYIDRASGDLIMGATVGKHYESAILTVRKAGEEPLEYLIITMKRVHVSSFSTGGSGGEQRLTENVSLNFEEAEWQYTEQTRDGSAGGQSSAFVSGSMGKCR